MLTAERLEQILIVAADQVAVRFSSLARMPLATCVYATPDAKLARASKRPPKAPRRGPRSPTVERLQETGCGVVPGERFDTPSKSAMPAAMSS